MQSESDVCFFTLLIFFDLQQYVLHFCSQHLQQLDFTLFINAMLLGEFLCNFWQTIFITFIQSYSVNLLSQIHIQNKTWYSIFNFRCLSPLLR